jgi:hypothetical protein
MSPDPADLTTVANLEAWMGLTNVAQPVADQLQRLITAASLWMQTYISRTIRSQAYTETRDGQGGNRLVLGNEPVTAVSSVMIDGQSIPASPGFGQAGYIFTGTAIILTGYLFNRGDANVKVSYTGGFTSTPLDLEQACLDLASMRWKERDRIGHASKTIGAETVTFITKDMSDFVKTTLAKYDSVIPV